MDCIACWARNLPCHRGTLSGVCIPCNSPPRLDIHHPDLALSPDLLQTLRRPCRSAHVLELAFAGSRVATLHLPPTSDLDEAVSSLCEIDRVVDQAPLPVVDGISSEARRLLCVLSILCPLRSTTNPFATSGPCAASDLAFFLLRRLARLLNDVFGRIRADLGTSQGRAALADLAILSLCFAKCLAGLEDGTLQAPVAPRHALVAYLGKCADALRALVGGSCAREDRWWEGFRAGQRDDLRNYRWALRWKLKVCPQPLDGPDDAWGQLSAAHGTTPFTASDLAVPRHSVPPHIPFVPPAWDSGQTLPDPWQGPPLQSLTLGPPYSTPADAVATGSASLGLFFPQPLAAPDGLNWLVAGQPFFPLLSHEAITAHREYVSGFVPWGELNSLDLSLDPDPVTYPASLNT